MSDQTVTIVVPEKRPVQLAPEALPTGFGYSVIYSGENFDRMVEWYRVLFQGTVQPVDGEMPEDLLLVEDSDVVVIERRPNHTATPRGWNVGFIHLAWSYSSVAELMWVYRHARDQGIKPIGVMNTGILIQFYYVDPDGNTIELEVDCHDTSIETQNVQRAADLKRTAPPKEWDFDPETMLAMLEDGVPDSVILSQERYHALAATPRYSISTVQG